MRYGCLVSLFLVGVLAAPGHASFTMPRHVYRIDQLNDAKDAAKDKNVPITFIYTDESTDCGLCKAASLDAAEELMDHAVIIYVDTERDQDWDQTPDLVRRALNSPAAGKYIPKTVIVDRDVRRVLCILPYIRNDEQRKDTLQTIRAKIRN